MSNCHHSFFATLIMSRESSWTPSWETPPLPRQIWRRQSSLNFPLVCHALLHYATSLQWLHSGKEFAYIEKLLTPCEIFNILSRNLNLSSGRAPVGWKF